MLKKWVHLTMLTIFWVLELLHIVPKGRNVAIKTVAMCVYSMRDGGKSGIFTPAHMIIAKKPTK
jgi:sterol 24-C-methyltransferase